MWVWILGQQQNHLEAPQNVGCKLIMSMPRLLEHRESHNSIGQSSLFMYKTIVPHYRNLDHVSHKTEHTLTLEIVYQSKSETEIDLKEKCLKQDEELRGSTGRPEKNSHRHGPLDNTSKPYWLKVLSDGFPFNTYCLNGKEKTQQKKNIRVQTYCLQK